jgi:signal transduction histidine kinase
METRLEARSLTVDTSGRFWAELWLSTALHGLLIVGVLFGSYELVERTLLTGASEAMLHRLHLARGLTSSFVLATWAFLNVRRARLERDQALEQHLAELEQRVRLRTHELADTLDFSELLFDAMPERITVRDGAGRVVKQNRVARESGSSGATSHVWESEEVELGASALRPALVLELSRDVTETRELQARLQHQEKMASLGLLAAGIAHDLGNPLASLSTELELLETETDPAAMRASLSVLRAQVDRMTRSLREVVDFARRRGSEPSEVRLDEAVADSARLVCHDPRWLNVRLELDLPRELPPVHLVEDQLVLVLVNLLFNAADAIAGTGQVTVSARATERGVRLQVSDDGSGMSAETLARASEPLFTTKAERGGTGLGLAVCERVVREAGGQLSLESELGRGTRVTIDLPVRGGEPRG